MSQRARSNFHFLDLHSCVTSLNLVKASDCLSIEKTAHVHQCIFLVSLWPSMELNALISAADIESALQNYLGADRKNASSNISFTVTKATEKVQGFLSLILRVKVTYSDEDGENNVSFIVKRTPVSELQLQYTSGSDFYARESDFFNIAQPLLLKNLRYQIIFRIIF